MKIYRNYLSNFDPLKLEKFTVVCEEHNEQIPFEMSRLMITEAKYPELILEEEAKQVIYDNCSGCVIARNTVETKWPEGSEL